MHLNKKEYSDSMENVESKVNGKADEKKTCLSFKEKFTYSLGQTAVSFSPALVSSWLIYYYIGREDAAGNKLLLVSAVAMSLGGLIPRFIEALAEPLVGYYSDKWNFRWGRRIPWVVFGTPLLALFSVLIWFPPERAASGAALFQVFTLEVTPNVIWLLVMHTGFWIMYTAVVAPYLSLLPEITPYNDERINVSMFMAYNDVAGSVLGSLGLGVMLGVFASGMQIGGWRLSNAYEVCGVLIGLVFTVLFLASVSVVRERPFHQAKAVKFKFREAFTETFRNPTFTPYVVASAAIRISTDIILAGMPFMVTRIMGFEDKMAAYLQGVIILGAAFFFPFVSKWAVNRGKKPVYLLGMFVFVLGLVSFGMMKHVPFFGWLVSAVAGLLGFEMTEQWIIFAHCIGTAAMCAIPISIIFVMQRPILNDVMDYDEKLTGYRREAMYNGMEGLISKPASGIAYFIVPLLLKYLGDSPEHPWGVLSAPLCAAVCMFIGWWAFRSYQIEK